MPIFSNSDGKFRKLHHARFDREKTLQSIVEGNLQEMLDMHFLESEYPTTAGGRIDTLAVDNSGAPVIIEYKLSKNEQVINQALSYLKWLKAQKADFFEMLVHKRLPPEIARKIQVDWKNPRVVCIAESYSKFDIDTAEVIPLRIELLLYRHYEGGLFSLEPLMVSGQEVPPLPPVPTDPKKVSNALEALLLKGTPETRDLFMAFRGKLLGMDEAIVERVTAEYVAYRVTKSFAEAYVLKNKVRFFVRPIDYVDPKGAVKKIPDGYNWTLNRSFYLETAADIEYALGLIEQAYQDVI